MTYRDFELANERMAASYKLKGYHYHFDHAQGAGHLDGNVVAQTLPPALLYVWRGYPIDGSGARGAVLTLGALLDLVEEIELVDRARGAFGRGRLGRDGLARLQRLKAVVADKAGDDVPRAFDDLLLGELDAVPRLEHTNSVGDVFHQKPHRVPCRPRSGHVTPHDGRKIATSFRRGQGNRRAAA
jgi:hypothetical protein